MSARRALLIVSGCIAAGAVSLAQVGRGGSQWLAPLGDAQRTSWVRSDDKISVQSLGKPGFELQWKSKLDNAPRGGHGLGQGVTASGVTLFVPMSVVTGSSNTVFGIDNDIGYVVWRRQFEAGLPAATAECPGGITSGATRIVRLDGTTAPGFGGFGGRGSVGYRTLLGEPGEGVPLEGRGRGGARGAAPAGPPAAAAAGRQGAAPAGGRQGGGAPAGRGNPPAERIPGSPRTEEAAGFGFLARPSGVAYVIASDGRLHVLGLASGKDIQRPAPFLPANARWSAPVAVGTTLYAATSGRCGGAPAGVWAIDLDSDAKPVTSWKSGGDVVGAVAFAQDGTLLATIGRGGKAGDGIANAIVALDPKTLQLRSSFTAAATEFATGPTILRHGGRDIVAVAATDGRVFLLDAASFGAGSNSAPLYVSKPLAGGKVSADALAAWQQMPPAVPGAGAAAAAPSSPVASWILVPAGDRVVALKVGDANGSLSLEPGWTSQALASPATPLVINGVVFALSRGQAPVLNAYDGVTGTRLWHSGKAIASAASSGSLWTGLGQIYVGAVDGTMYAFGFNDERRPE